MNWRNQRGLKAIHNLQITKIKEQKAQMMNLMKKNNKKKFRINNKLKVRVYKIAINKPN